MILPIYKTNIDNEGNRVGAITFFGDGIVVVKGLDRAFIGEVIHFNDKDFGQRGMVLNIEPDCIKIALLDGNDKQLHAGDLAFRTYKYVETFSGFGIIGKVINPLGACLNKNDFDPDDFLIRYLTGLKMIKVECKAPGIIDREPVRRNLHTGLNSVDAMLPIGAGQRELILGDLGSGKTTLAVTVILNQRSVNYNFWRNVEQALIAKRNSLFLPCIYVVVGGRRSEAARIKWLLQASGAMAYTALVFTSADDLAALQYMAPYAGCAMGEWFRDNGYRALVVYDDLSIHAQAYRQVSLLLRRPPGREAYPGDIFYLHSRLLERAAQMNKRLGGGSLTALPIVETRAGDISAYIPTNIISITDGQIYLSMKLANQGIKPAIDLNLSVSRVGSDAQTNMLKYISKKTKIEYNLYRAFQFIERLGGDIDPDIARFIRKGKQIVAFFKQELYDANTLYQQIVCLHAIAKGYTDNVHPSFIAFFFRLLFDLELASTYLRPELFIFLKNRKQLDIICLNNTFDLIEDEIDGWISDYLVAYNDNYSHRAMAAASLMD